MIRFLFTALFLLLLLPGKCGAQAVPDTASLNIIRNDSIARARRQSIAPTDFDRASVADTIAYKHLFQPIPKRAALFSAMLPGAGQFYNRQYWKLAVVYVGVGASAFFLIDNTNQYQKYRKAYVARLTDPSVQDEYTNLWSSDPAVAIRNLQTLQDAYKRYLDLTYLLTGVGYALQVMDALAFSHLRNFDVSPNISMRLQPVSTPAGPAFGLVAHF